MPIGTVNQGSAPYGLAEYEKFRKADGNRVLLCRALRVKWAGALAGKGHGQHIVDRAAQHAAVHVPQDAGLQMPARYHYLIAVRAVGFSAVAAGAVKD